MSPAKATEQNPAVQEGDVIAGKYRVGEQVASGGMGAIVRGRHMELDQDVAIKILHPEMCDEEELTQRFLREARIAARIDSEHVVRVYDVGRTEAGVPYMVMEFLDGVDLEALIKFSGEQPVVEAVDHILQALNAVIEAHAEGIVHRDLKPANLFLASRPGRAPRVKVLDFGISKLPPGGDAAPSLTSTRAMLGSPGYMSPEQIVSTRDVDERSDLWSLGVILYELLTGVQAYTGQTLGQVFAQIRETDLPSVRTVRPDVPAGLDKVLRKCLARDRDKRYRSAEVLRDKLAPFASVLTRTMVMADRRSEPDMNLLAGLEPVPSTLIEGEVETESAPGQANATVVEGAGGEQATLSSGGGARASEQDDAAGIPPSDATETQHSVRDGQATLMEGARGEQVSRQTVATWAATSSGARARGPLAALGLLVVLAVGAAAWWGLQPGLVTLAADGSGASAAALGQRLAAAAGEQGTAPASSAAAPGSEPSAAASTSAEPQSSAEPAGSASAKSSSTSGLSRPPRPRLPVAPVPNPTAAPPPPKYDDLGI